MPRWAHYCRVCHYVGTIGDADIYYCNKLVDGCFDVVIRTGEEDSEYASRRISMPEIEKHFEERGIGVSSLDDETKIVHWALATLSCAFSNTLRRI